jgi:enediyne biosynthesis protein E4
VFGNYVDRDAPGSPWGTCADHVLMRPAVSAGQPDYSGAELLSPGFCTLSMLFTDWNNSGEMALRVTNDRQYYRGGEEQLWRLEPGRPARPFAGADGWESLKIWGMGIAEADLDGDGFAEYALTSMADTKLQTLSEPGNTPRPVYTDIAFGRGVTAQQPYMGPDKLPSTGWHAEFADFNNDGRLDLFIAKGNVAEMAEFAAFDPDNLLLQGADGGFVEAGDVAGIGLDRRGRGAIVEDFNNDGWLDLVVINREQNVSVFRNLGPQSGGAANWLSVRLVDIGGNINGVDARVVIEGESSTMVRRVAVGGGHASGRSGPVRFGLGGLENVSLRVEWADGASSDIFSVAANQAIVIERNARGFAPE